MFARTRWRTPVIDRQLLSLLACPVDRGSVRVDGERLTCSRCSRRYAIRDGIPVMLAGESEPPADS
jgi:uncharacterized protein YbaR (Trm112 family)